MVDWVGSNIQQTKVPRRMISWLRMFGWRVEVQRIDEYRTRDYLVKEGVSFRYEVG